MAVSVPRPHTLPAQNGEPGRFADMLLTASIAHEIVQPLSGVIINVATCLRMLEADPPNVEGARDTVQRAMRDGNRASDMVTRLRALFTRQRPIAKSVDLNEVARGAIELSSAELRRGQVVLRAELADELPLVTGDFVQLQQVALNLLRNAVEAMSGIEDRPRKILVRTEQDKGDRVRFSVEDAGVGFAPKDAGQLFEAFYTTKSAGMGIGLCVSHSIVESHGGLMCAALNDGPGATFSFTLARRHT